MKQNFEPIKKTKKFKFEEEDFSKKKEKKKEKPRKQIIDYNQLEYYE